MSYHYMLMCQLLAHLLMQDVYSVGYIFVCYVCRVFSASKSFLYIYILHYSGTPLPT